MHLPGGHRAGTFEFDIEAVLVGVEPADAPCRLKIVFGEVLNDVAESFDDYKSVKDELGSRTKETFMLITEYLRTS